METDPVVQKGNFNHELVTPTRALLTNDEKKKKKEDEEEAVSTLSTWKRAEGLSEGKAVMRDEYMWKVHDWGLVIGNNIDRQPAVMFNKSTGERHMVLVHLVNLHCVAQVGEEYKYIPGHATRVPAYTHEENQLTLFPLNKFKKIEGYTQRKYVQKEEEARNRSPGEFSPVECLGALLKALDETKKKKTPHKIITGTSDQKWTVPSKQLAGLRSMLVRLRTFGIVAAGCGLFNICISWFFAGWLTFITMFVISIPLLAVSLILVSCERSMTVVLRLAGKLLTRFLSSEQIVVASDDSTLDGKKIKNKVSPFLDLYSVRLGAKVLLDTQCDVRDVIEKPITILQDSRGCNISLDVYDAQIKHKWWTLRGVKKMTKAISFSPSLFDHLVSSFTEPVDFEIVARKARSYSGYNVSPDQRRKLIRGTSECAVLAIVSNYWGSRDFSEYF
jgi:hypothetical protein